MQRFLELHTRPSPARAGARRGLGGPGLLIVAFVDSSFLTLPEVADILVVLFTIRRRRDWRYFAA